MKPSVQQKIDKLDSQLDSIFEEFQNISDDILNKKPTPETWSVLQTMNHMMLSEELSFKYVKKKLSYNPTLKEAGLLTWLRSFILRTYLATPLKFSAPKGVSTSYLPETSTFKEVKHQWVTFRKELRSYLDERPDEIFSKETYKHPFVGRITLEDMLEFYRSHSSRHRKQMRRILKTVQ